MNREEFSQAEYDSYWNLSPQERDQLLENEQTPDSIQALLLFQQGLQWAEKKEFTAAITNYEAALAIKPSYCEAWEQKGESLRLLKRYEEAIDSYDKAIAIRPDSPQTWAWRGYALASLKRHEEAIDSYDKAIAIRPDSSLIWAWRGCALASLKRYEEAIDSYDKAIAIRPDCSWTWALRGEDLARLKRYEGAIDSYDKAIAIRPDYSVAWALRGEALAILERYEEAVDSYDRAIEIQPDYHWAWGERGNVLAKLERYEEAILSYDKAIEMQSDDYWNWVERGDALAKLKRYEEAVLSYDKALERESNLKVYCFWRKREIIRSNNKLLPYLANQWARGRRSFWGNLHLIYFIFQFQIILCTTLILIVLFQGSFLAEILKGILSVIFTGISILLISGIFINFRKNIDISYKAYFRSGFLSYVRAFLICVITMLIGSLIYTYSPNFLRFGWGNLVFTNSGNWAITQPFEVANQAAETASTIQENLAVQTPEISDESKTEGNHFDFRWIFIPTLWFSLILSLPLWAKWEEEQYRKGIHTWKGITINSIKFGLIHLFMGIPICWGLSLSIPGFLFACRYKYVYQRHLTKFGDEQKAQEAGVVASTADHAIYNAIIITLLTAAFLL